MIFEESINTNEARVYAAKQLNPHLDNGLQFTIISKTLNEYPLDYSGKTLLNLSGASSGVFLVSVPAVIGVPVGIVQKLI